MFSNQTRENSTKYVEDSIKYICKEIGPREPGTASELKCQEWLKSEIEKNNWANEVKIEPFIVSRHALVGFTKIIAVMLMIASIFQLTFFANNLYYKIFSTISLFLVISSFFILITEFGLYLKVIDKFLPQSISTNLYAKIKPSGEIKKRIVFNGHTDSAYEWSLMKIHQNFMIFVLGTIAIANLAFLGIIIAALATDLNNLKLGSLILGLITFVLDIGLFFMCNFNVVVPGANDNLTGTMISMAVLKAIKEENIQFENTEVCIMLSGSEEAGLRGAEAWGKAHKQELTEIDTAVIVFDTLRDKDYATIYTRDMTCLVKNSQKVASLLDKAAAKSGYHLPHHGVPFGASDAAALSKQGIHACCVAAQNPKGTTWYHNTRDCADNLNPETIRLGVDLALNALEIFDKEGF